MSWTFTNSGKTEQFTAKSTVLTIQAKAEQATIILYAVQNGKYSLIGSFTVSGCETTDKSFNVKPGQLYLINITDGSGCITVEIIHSEGYVDNSKCGCCQLPDAQYVYDQINQIGDNDMYTSWMLRNGGQPGTQGLTGFGEIDPTTGAITTYFTEEPSQIDPTPNPSPPPGALVQWVEFNGVSGNSTDEIIYAIRKTTEVGAGGAIAGSDQGQLVSYDKTTSTYSVLTAVTEAGQPVAPVAAGFNNDDGFIYVADPGAVYRLDETTGVLTTMPIDILSITGGTVGSIDLDFKDGDLHIMIDGTVYVGDVNAVSAPVSPANYEFTGYTNPADSLGGYAITVDGGVTKHYLIANNLDLLESEFTGAAPTVVSTLTHPSSGSFTQSTFNDLATTKIIQEASAVGPLLSTWCLEDGQLVETLSKQNEQGIWEPYEVQGTVDSSALTTRVVVGSGTNVTTKYGDGQAFHESVEDFVIKVLAGLVTVTMPSGDVFTATAGEVIQFGNGTERNVKLNGLSVVGTDATASWRIEVDV